MGSAVAEITRNETVWRTVRIQTPMQYKMSFHDPKPKCRFAISVTSLAFNDISVKGDSIIKPPHEKSVLVKS